MNTTELEMLFTYNRWANNRVLDAAEPLSDELLQRDLKSSFPSIHATLVHMVGAEWVWLERWQGRSPTAFPADRLPTVADIRHYWKTVEDGQRAVLGALDTAGLERRLAFRSFAGKDCNDRIGDTMQHVVNHASYHRGQVTTMMRQVGAKPGGTDYITFLREAL